jgi:hypothetical protein
MLIIIHLFVCLNAEKKPVRLGIGMEPISKVLLVIAPRIKAKTYYSRLPSNVSLHKLPLD